MLQSITGGFYQLGIIKNLICYVSLQRVNRNHGRAEVCGEGHQSNCPANGATKLQRVAALEKKNKSATYVCMSKENGGVGANCMLSRLF